MSLVDEHEVPGPGGEHLIATASTTSQMGAGEENGKRAPRITRSALDLLLVDIEEAPAIEPRDSEGELLGELLLPLLENRGGHEQQDAFGFAGHEEFTNDQADLDRLAESDFVCKEVAARGRCGRRSREDAVESAFPHRFATGVRGRIGRNAASSWTQSGHLTGRTNKIGQLRSAKAVTWRCVDHNDRCGAQERVSDRGTKEGEQGLRRRIVPPQASQTREHGDIGTERVQLTKVA
jgi:hypothetical protein